MRQHNFGFTIIEGVVVTAMLGIILGLGIPNYLNYLAKMEVRQAVQDMASTIDEIRGEVKRNGNCQKLSLAGNNSLKIDIYPNNDCSATPTTTQVNLPGGATIVQKSGSAVTFIPPMAVNKSGVPADFTITSRNVNMDVRITGVLGRVVAK